jgi:trehalose synthase
MPELAEVLGDRVVWNVNSTARGGGVAELLSSLLPYERGCGVDARWLVITGSPEFFAVTKRIHNLLHGITADGSELTDAERARYQATLADNADALRRRVKSGDVVVLHDPQTAGLIPALADAGCQVIWRCHIGIDHPNAPVRVAWDFLRGYVRAADASVFSRRAYVWEGLDDARVHIIAPSIDPFTPKNQELDDDTVSAILHRALSLPSVPPRLAGEPLSPSPSGGGQGGGGGGGSPVIRRQDGSVIQLTRSAEMVEASPPPADARLVVQVSRWDQLKDPLGVMDGFARYVAPHTDGHLVLAGPAASAIPDDPEGPAMLHRVEDAWRGLPQAVHERVHLAGLPMADLDENAVMVNALQRRAHVIVQKSIAEGFGLTVAEAMWKGRPVVATRVGGIQDQIEDGQSGVLIDDPHDLAAFGAAVTRLLRDPAAADRLGAAAKQRVRREFLAPRQLTQQAQLLIKVLRERTLA